MAALLGLGAAINTWVEASLMPTFSQDYSYSGCVVTDQTSESSAAVNVPDSSVGGSLAEPSLPGSVAFCVTFLTAGRGRSSRGRNYIPAIAEPFVIGNTLDLTQANLYVAAYEALFAVATDQNVTWVVVSHQTAGAPRVAGLAQPVTGVRYADRFIDSQRRRLTGRGT